MKRSKEEQERAYYNRKLITDGMKDELKKPYSWKTFGYDFVQFFLGNLLGRRVIDAIGTETLIKNEAVRFIVEVLIIAAMILVVDLIIAGIRKLLQRNRG